jgi:hypothetical protein
MVPMWLIESVHGVQRGYRSCSLLEPSFSYQIVWRYLVDYRAGRRIHNQALRLYFSDLIISKDGLDHGYAVYSSFIIFFISLFILT